MVYNYCTLFDSGYLDKGLVLCESLNQVTESYMLYILAMDSKCENVLKDMKLNNVVVVSLEEFEDEDMKQARMNRSHTEYCWTCSSAFVYYLIHKKGLDNCTYIDADMKFYCSPNILVAEIKENGCSIGIMEHDYPDNIEGRHFFKSSGRFCVEFNTFFADMNGLKALSWWKQQCLDGCREQSDGKVFGDQLYLQDWPTRFDGVYVHKNRGAGMAPWNIMKYHYDENQNIVYMKKNIVNKIFYHFHGVKLIDQNHIFMNTVTRKGKHDYVLLKDLYIDYGFELQKQRDFLEKNYAIHYSYSNGTDKVSPKIGGITRIQQWFETGVFFLLGSKIRSRQYGKLDFLELEQQLNA